MTVIQVSYLPPSLWSALTWKYLLQSLLCKMHFSIFVVPLLLDEWRRVMIYLAAAARHWVGVASVRSHKQDRVLEQRCGRGVGREPAADSLSLYLSLLQRPSTIITTTPLYPLTNSEPISPHGIRAAMHQDWVCRDRTGKDQRNNHEGCARSNLQFYGSFAQRRDEGGRNVGCN